VELSFAHFKNRFDSLTKVVLLANCDIMLVSYGGHCSLLGFDTQKGGECVEKMTDNFISKIDESPVPSLNSKSTRMSTGLIY